MDLLISILIDYLTQLITNLILQFIQTGTLPW